MAGRIGRIRHTASKINRAAAKYRDPILVVKTLWGIFWEKEN